MQHIKKETYLLTFINVKLNQSMHIFGNFSMKLYLIFMDCYNYKQKSLPYLKIPRVMLNELSLNVRYCLFTRLSFIDRE